MAIPKFTSGLLFDFHILNFVSTLMLPITITPGICLFLLRCSARTALFYCYKLLMEMTIPVHYHRSPHNFTVIEDSSIIILSFTEIYWSILLVTSPVYAQRLPNNFSSNIYSLVVSLHDNFLLLYSFESCVNIASTFPFNWLKWW